MITAATATDVCFVHVLDDTERSLTLTGATPPFDSEVGKIRLPLGQGVSGWVASHREPVVIIHDKESDPRYKPFESLRGSDFTSMVSVPMETDPGGLVGVLNVHTVQRREFTDRDVELLLVIGRLIAGAMHQARLHRQLVARDRAHENFVEQVIQAQELERRRLAGDIHDGISQRLVTLSYRLDAASRAVGDDAAAAAEQFGRRANSWTSPCRRPVRRSTDCARRCSTTSALPAGWPAWPGPSPQVDIDVDLADTRLPDHIEIALYRIAQECLQNVVKHAARHQREADVLRGRRRRPALEIVDNGVGFDTFEHPLGGDEMGGYGLLSMAERAEIVGGRLNIRSRPGSGTAVTATIPLPAPRARRRPLEIAGVAPQRSRSPPPASATRIADMPMSANTSLLSVTVASSTVERPRSVSRTSVVRPSVGCGIRSTRPSLSSRRMACVTLVTWTCRRSEALVIGSAPLLLNASSRSSSYREKLRSYGRNAVSTRASRIWCARITDVTATMPSATSPHPARSQFSRANAIGSRLVGSEDTPLHTARGGNGAAIWRSGPAIRPRTAPKARHATTARLPTLMRTPPSA